MKPSLRVYATEAPVATATPANQRPASPAMSQDSCRDSAAAGRRKANGKAQRGTCQVESLQVEGGESPPVRWPHPPPPRLDSFVPGGAAADQIFFPLRLQRFSCKLISDALREESSKLTKAGLSLSFQRERERKTPPG